MKLSSFGLLCRLRGFCIVILLIIICENITDLKAFSTTTTTTTSRLRRYGVLTLSPFSLSSTTTTTTITATSLFGILWDPTKTNAERDNNKLFVDFPTPSQRKFLKKEVQKKQARKELVTITLPQDDDGGNYQQTTMDDDDDHDHDHDHGDHDDDHQTNDDDDSSNDDDEEEEDGHVEFVCPFETSTVQAVWDTFIEKETEVIQVRGLSRQNKASVFTVAEILCWAIESLQELEEEEEEEGIVLNDIDDDDNDANDDANVDTSFAEDDIVGEDDDDVLEEIPPIHEVTLLSTKGHAAILYCPHLELDHPNKIVLHTSVGQKNTWKARIKAPRDDRGQIIPKELR